MSMIEKTPYEEEQQLRLELLKLQIRDTKDVIDYRLDKREQEQKKEKQRDEIYPLLMEEYEDVKLHRRNFESLYEQQIEALNQIALALEMKQTESELYERNVAALERIAKALEENNNDSASKDV